MTHKITYYENLSYDDILQKRYRFSNATKKLRYLPLISVHSEIYRVALCYAQDNAMGYAIVPQIKRRSYWCTDGFLFGKKSTFYLDELPSESDLVSMLITEFYNKYPQAKEGYYDTLKPAIDVIALLSENPTKSNLDSTMLKYFSGIEFREGDLGYNVFDGEILITCEDADLYIPFVKDNSQESDGFILILEYSRMEFNSLTSACKYNLLALFYRVKNILTTALTEVVNEKTKDCKKIN